MKIDRNNAYDVYIPDSLKDDDTAVIYCHGGAFRYGDKGDDEKYSIDAVVLVSGYLLFEEEDGITNALCMFPAFQYFPTELKNVDMDYSGYKLPERVLLVTGDGDGCKKDSEVLYAALKKTASAKPEIVCAASDSEETDHCFIINDPYSEVAQRVFARIIECVNPMAE